VRRDVVMVKHPGLFSPKFGATSSHVLKNSPQNITVEPGIHILTFGGGASRYRNCCIDDGASPEYFGYHLVRGLI
jgi:hypothetical protein